MTEGDRLRDEGMDRVRTPPRAYMIAFRTEAIRLASTGYEFTIEDVEAVVGLCTPRNWLGPGMGGLSREGLIEAVGRRKASRGTRHSNENRVWVGTVKAKRVDPLRDGAHTTDDPNVLRMSREGHTDQYVNLRKAREQAADQSRKAAASRIQAEADARPLVPHPQAVMFKPFCRRCKGFGGTVGARCYPCDGTGYEK